MRNSNDNRVRAFSDVVSLEAWHPEFTDKSPRADLHVHVVFGTARLGGEIESQVRFRLSIKRAEVVVIIPETEPLDVDPSSICRELATIEGKRSKKLSSSSQQMAGASLGLKFTGKGASGQFSGKASADLAKRATETMTLSEKISLHLVSQSKTAEGFYRWIVQMLDGRAISDAPWDGNKKPRLKIVDRRKNKRAGIPPSVRVEVRCLREDLLIDDLELKEESKWERLLQRDGAARRLAAAEGYIRDQLIKAGLEVSNIEDKFGTLVLSSVIASTTKK